MKNINTKVVKLIETEITTVGAKGCEKRKWEAAPWV